MDIESMRVRLRHLEPLILTSSDGSLRVLEKSARVVCHVPVSRLADEEAVAAEIEGVLSAPVGFRRQPLIWLRVNVLSEALALDGICRVLVTLTEFLKPHANVQLILHFPEPPKEWESILRVARLLRETDGQRKDFGIEVIGPFSASTDSEMESLGDLGIRIIFAAGWIKGCSPKCCSDVDTAALHRFSRFGFRAPVAWYVHANNIAEIEGRLPDRLISNCYSGFSLPLVVCNPYYQIGESFPSIPDARDYCELLVRSYKQYPYYDDVLAPLNELAMLIRNGGWHSQFSLPVAIQVLVSSDGQVGLYRQIPALAVPWSSISEVVNTEAESLRSRFLEFAAAAWHWQKNPYCRDCCWRYICGGLDAPASLRNGASEMDCICSYRKLFLEHFALVRAPNVVLGSRQESG